MARLLAKTRELRVCAAALSLRDAGGSLVDIESSFLAPHSPRYAREI